jgi:hypothetical protein
MCRNFSATKRKQFVCSFSRVFQPSQCALIAATWTWLSSTTSASRIDSPRHSTSLIRPFRSISGTFYDAPIESDSPVLRRRQLRQTRSPSPVGVEQASHAGSRQDVQTPLVHSSQITQGRIKGAGWAPPFMIGLLLLRNYAFRPCGNFTISMLATAFRPRSIGCLFRKTNPELSCIWNGWPLVSSTRSRSITDPSAGFLDSC